MNVRILATGSSGNCVLLDDEILIDAGITAKKFKTFNVTPKTLFITHKHNDHMQLPLVRKLLKEGVKSYFPTDVIAEIAKENKINIQDYINSGQVVVISTDESYTVGDVVITPYPQKHHDIINYAFVVEKGNDRLLYSTDLDTVEPTDVGVGLLHLGMFDTILLEGNYDESYLRDYIEYMISLVPDTEDPSKSSDDDLEKWVKANYRSLPDDIARNAFRAIQNHRHLSKQQARAYASTHLKPNGTYYEIHRSKTFYEEPAGWREEV